MPLCIIRTRIHDSGSTATVSAASAQLRTLVAPPKQLAMNVTGSTICRFVAPDGLMRYSVRERLDGLFVVVHDGTALEDGSQPYWMEDRVLSGLFGSAELAEGELRRMIWDGWAQEV